MTGHVKIVFDSEGLAETLRLLRLAAGDDSDGEVTKAETFKEILRLSDHLEPLLQLGHLFKIDNEIVVTSRATHTLCLLEPTERLREHCAALRVRTLEG